jgi:branched-chain amino acid transport system substrate-binding protein
MLLRALAVLSAAAVASGAVSSAGGADPGVSATQIVLGATGPLSGPESAYAPVLNGANAYFRYVNDHGGVFGRKIVYRIEDDGFEPAQTVDLTRKLVEQEDVFAIFNSVGTPNALAVRPYLNQLGVPQLFVGSGADSIAAERVQYPWTIAMLPSFTGEGAIYGRYVARSLPRARIGVLYEDSEYGMDLLAGLRRGLGRQATHIVATASYEFTDLSVTSQVESIRAAGADTFVLCASPKQAIQAFVAAARAGWKPHYVVASPAIDPFVMKVVRLTAGPGVGEGAVSSGWLRDPTDPALAQSPGVKLYRQIMRRYLPNADQNALAHLYGIVVAYLMTDALRHAGRNPTRASLLRAVQHLQELDNPFLLPGAAIRMQPGRVFPVTSTRLVRFTKGRWRLFGPLQQTSP